MDVQTVDIKTITPYESNPRRNSKSVGKVADSIKEYGWRQPIVVDEDMVILAGHTRHAAAKRLKFKKVPIHIAKGLTPEQAKAYRIMDNRSADDSAWDDDLLSIEMDELLSSGFEMSLTGFDGYEIDKLLSGGGGVEGEDDVPESAPAVTKPGDLWVFGNHRLKCGDATNAADVEHVLGKIKPHLMVTDPPYGVDYDAKWRSIRGLQTDGAYGRVTNDERAEWTDAWTLFPGDVAYVWHASLNTPIFAEGLVAAGFDLRAQIIWVKDRVVIGRGHYHWQHEPCWYAVKNNGHWCGSRKQSTIWNIDKPMKSETGHSTQKPVECMRRPILNNSNPGQVVYDPFLGSGTTIIAAESEGRYCYGLELEPLYCDIIVKRWEMFTGEAAKRV